VTIAVIDTGINPGAPGLAEADLEVHEPSYCAAEEGGPALPAASDQPASAHGTGITSLLVGDGERPDGRPGVLGVAPGATVHYYSVAAAEGQVTCLPPSDNGRDRDAFGDAVAAGADIINVSAAMLIDEADYAAAIRAGVIVVGAAGNGGGEVLGSPAELNGTVAVGTATPEAALDPGSPTGPALGVVAPGTDFLCVAEDFVTEARCTGSSNATAYTSGVLALAWSAHPDATGNQILQALVRSTDGEAIHEPRRDDEWGYGLVNARLLLETDPTSYPDVNPFVRDDPEAFPPATALLGASPEPTAATGADQGDDGAVAVPDADTAAGGAPLLRVVGGIIGLVAVSAIVIAVVLSARRRSRPGTADPHQHATASQTHQGGLRG
jgi:hypothetical protein